MAAAGEENAQERRRAAPRLKGLWTCAVAVARQAGVRSPWPAPSCTGTDPQPWQSHKQLSQPSHDPAVWVWLGFFFRTVFRSACVPSLSPGAAEHVVSRLRDRGPRAGAARPVTMDDRTCRWAGKWADSSHFPRTAFSAEEGGIAHLAWKGTTGGPSAARSWGSAHGTGLPSPGLSSSRVGPVSPFRLPPPSPPDPGTAGAGQAGRDPPPRITPAKWGRRSW